MHYSDNSFHFAENLARRELYRFISAAMLPKSDGSPLLSHPAVDWAAIVMGSMDLLREDLLFTPATLGPGELSPQSVRIDLFSGGLRGIEEEYARVFSLGIGKRNPPYETEYCVNRDLTYRSQQMADVAGFYRAFGLDLTKTHERVDHLAVEAEFMSVLIGREMHAVAENLGAEALEVCRHAQQSFFKDHFCWWVPAFAVALSRRERAGFYADFAEFLRAFIAAERAILKVAPLECGEGAFQP